MTGEQPLRVAMLTHSTNPRGGVVHALELADALTRRGHHVAVHAPDPSQHGFGRTTACHTISVPAAPAAAGLAALVHQRATEYLQYFESPAHRAFDVWHAHDGISASALAALKQRGLINSFARTVHHVDRFADPIVAGIQEDGLRAADLTFAVSRLWRTWLADTMGIDAAPSGNGVDTGRFTPVSDGTDARLRARLDLARGDVVLLAVGGIEERKNTQRTLEAFALVRSRIANARLLIAGGVSLLEHDAYQHGFADRLRALALPPGAVLQVGRLAHEEMPALYRLADALIFPSLREGFGLVVLEALASGVPAVISRIAPFTEYLPDDAAAWCDPLDASSIAAAGLRTLDPHPRRQLIDAGRRVAVRFGWDAVAGLQLVGYRRLPEHAHA